MHLVSRIIADKEVNHIKQTTGFGISECMVHIIADKKVDHIKDNTDCAFSISKGMLHIIIDKDNHIKENTCHRCAFGIMEGMLHNIADNEVMHRSQIAHLVPWKACYIYIVHIIANK